MCKLKWLGVIFAIVSVNKYLHKTEAYHVKDINGGYILMAARDEPVDIVCRMNGPIDYCIFLSPKMERIEITENIDNQCSFTLNATWERSGKWQCDCGNFLTGERKLETIVLKMVGEIVAPDSNITAIMKESVTLSCFATKKQPLKICRFVPPNKRHLPFNINPSTSDQDPLYKRYHFPPEESLEHGNCSVTIREVDSLDQGRWKCIGIFYNNETTHRDFIDLKVEDHPVVSAIIIGFMVVIIGTGFIVAYYVQTRPYFSSSRYGDVEENIDLRDIHSDRLSPLSVTPGSTSPPPRTIGSDSSPEFYGYSGIEHIQTVAIVEPQPRSDRSAPAERNVIFEPLPLSERSRPVEIVVTVDRLPPSSEPLKSIIVDEVLTPSERSALEVTVIVESLPPSERSLIVQPLPISERSESEQLPPTELLPPTEHIASIDQLPPPEQFSSVEQLLPKEQLPPSSSDLLPLTEQFPSTEQLRPIRPTRQLLSNEQSLLTEKLPSIVHLPRVRQLPPAEPLGHSDPFPPTEQFQPTEQISPTKLLLSNEQLPPIEQLPATKQLATAELLVSSEQSALAESFETSELLPPLEQLTLADQLTQGEQIASSDLAPQAEPLLTSEQLSPTQQLPPAEPSLTSEQLSPAEQLITSGTEESPSAESSGTYEQQSSTAQLPCDEPSVSSDTAQLPSAESSGTSEAVPFVHRPTGRRLRTRPRPRLNKRR